MSAARNANPRFFEPCGCSECGSCDDLQKHKYSEELKCLECVNKELRELEEKEESESIFERSIETNTEADFKWRNA